MAVYTPLTNETISEFLATNYAVGDLEFAVGIAQGVENTNYLIVTRDAAGAEQKYILTLYEKRLNPDDLPFFIGLMQHVASKGVSCPRPIPRREGALFGACGEKQSALIGFLHGKSRSVIRNPHVASVGAALAALHHATADFPGMRANTLSLSGWQKLYEKLAGRLDSIAPGLDDLVESELAFATQHFPETQTLPRGVIHADLFPDNVFFEGDDVSGMIDFYFACTDALAYDVAVTLNAWCFEPRHEFNATKSKLLLAAYQKLRPFTAEEKSQFQILLRGAALRFLLTRAHDWIFHDEGALVRPHDPLEYAAKLRFHRGVKEVGEYFASGG